MKTSAEGIRRIHASEGFRATAYCCPAGVPTIGFGTTKGVTFEDVGVRTITMAEATQLAALDLLFFENAVNRLCVVIPTQAQLDSLVSLTYNIGVRAFSNSTVLRAHNRGDFMAAGRAFALFDKARVKGKLTVMKGLTRRRAEESAIYLSSLPGPAFEPLPQAVEPESKLTASPINRASVIAGGTAAVAVVTEITNAVSSLKTSVTGLGDWLLPVGLIVIVIACGYVIYNRYRQRLGGWA